MRAQGEAAGAGWQAALQPPLPPPPVEGPRLGPRLVACVALLHWLALAVAMLCGAHLQKA